jgi:flagellum-specific ATP synthase
MPMSAPHPQQEESQNALDRLERALAWGHKNIEPVRIGGVVTEVAMSHYRVAGLSRFLKLGQFVSVDAGGRPEMGEVVRIDGGFVTLKPFSSRCEAKVGSRAFRSETLSLSPHPTWKGRVIDALGRPIDGGEPLEQGDRPMALDSEPPPAMRRARVKEPIKTGIRAVDLFTPLCRGQRIGIFAGSGVGKSSMLAMLARARDFDTVVIALVGERGREVREFLDDTLAANRKSAIAVVSTGDESAMMRRLAPKTAMTVAEFFRDLGHSVLLIVDSVTRFAHAARDVALAAGEPAVARGYAPSVFSDMPRLLERAGPGLDGSGSITGVFSVLIDGDDHNDPVADGVRGTLDGHIVLDRSIADQGRYPAMNILSSISRLAHHGWSPEQRKLVARLRALIARYEDTRDLRMMGGYVAGSDPVLDQAINIAPKIYEAMTQAVSDEPSKDAFQELAAALKSETKPDKSARGSGS